MLQPEIHLTKIGQISVNTHNIEESVAFYRDMLGMKLLLQIPTMAFLECGDIRLMLSIPEKPEFDHPGSILYFSVENINATFDTLLERGVQFISMPTFVATMEPYDLYMAFFHDNAGNPLALMSEVRHS